MDPITYQNFDIAIERTGENQYRTRVISPAGPAQSEFALPFNDLELENFILRLGQTRRTVRFLGAASANTEQRLEHFGGQLYDAVISGDVLGSLQASQIASGKDNAGLRIRLQLAETPELINVPWEFMYDAGTGSFLCLSTRTPVVRYLPVRGQAMEPLAVEPPLRVLVMISSPSDVVELDVEQEWNKLREAVADLEQLGLIQLERMESARLDELQAKLRRNTYHVFHYIGHGGFDEGAQDGVLLLEDENDKARNTSGDFLGALLRDAESVRLAILNSCEGGRTAREDPFAGVGQKLVQRGVPAVMAMQFEVTDHAAITLSHQFYAALADGYPVDAALAEARKAIYIQPNVFKWGTPVLYMRSQDGRIFDIDQASAKPLAVPGPIVGDSTAETATVVLASTAAPVAERASHQDTRPATQSRQSQIKPFVSRLASAPVSVGINIATWAAAAGIIGFFVPWVLEPEGSASGARLATGQPQLWLVPLVCLGALVVHLLARSRPWFRAGIPLTILGALGTIFMWGEPWWYVMTIGWYLTMLGVLGVFAGGLASSILDSADERPSSLRFSWGYIIILAGGLATLAGIIYIGRSENQYRYEWLYLEARPVLIVTFLLVVTWVLALVAQRRGKLATWDGLAGIALASASIAYFIITGHENYADASPIGLLGALVMLVGGSVNLLSVLRQRLRERRTREAGESDHPTDTTIE